MKVTDNARGGYLTMKAGHLNGRLFNRMLAADGGALYNGEQGKILSALWVEQPQTATDLAIATGLANSTLTSMLRRLVEQDLICEVATEGDRRKKHFGLTEKGAAQQEVGDRVSARVRAAFYDGFDEAEVGQFEALLARVCANLEKALEETERN